VSGKVILYSALLDYPNASLKQIVQLVKAKLEESKQELIYRVYVTDCLKAISNSMSVKTRFYDLISENNNIPKKSSEQIKSEIFDVIKKIGGD
jgi:hypothetical protein